MNLIIGNYTLDILREGYSWNEHCGENGSHATSSVSLSVRPVDGFLTYLMTAESNLEAKIKDGSTTLFTGIVRPYTGTSFEGSYQESISLEIMDYTEAMHIYIYPETTDGQKTGCIYPQVWKDKTLSEMVGLLFGLGGKTISSFTSTESIPYFSLEGEQYLDEVISELLYEYGYDYKWNAEGKAVIFPTFVDGEEVGTIDDVRGNFSISRSDDTTDGLKVTWKEYEYQTDVPLYSFDSGNQTFNDGWGGQTASGRTLEGKLYSGTMHDTYFNPDSTMPSGNLWTWNFPDLSRSKILSRLLGERVDRAENTDSVLFVETDEEKISVSLLDEDGVTYTPVLESYDTNGMRMYVNYSGRFNVQLGKGWTWKVKVRGNIGTGVESESSYNIIGANPDTINLEYRLGLKGSEIVSEELVKQFYLRSKYSKITYSWQSLTAYTLGGFYTLEGNTVRITSRIKDSDGIYSYTAEGCKQYSEVTVSVNSEQNGNSKNSSAKSAYDIAVDNGYTGSEEEWLASLDGVSTALLYLYKRSAAQPDSFDGGTITYTFATGTMTGSFGTWSSTIPTGEETLYVISVRAKGKGESYSITSGEWSVPAVLSEQGSKGENGKTVVVVNLYQRATVSPATPTDTVTYDFSDNTVKNAGSWSQSIPDGTTALWCTQATAIGNGTSDSIEPAEWSTPKKIMENGESPVVIGLSSDSWLFPANEDGVVSADDYASFKVDVTAVKGSSAVDFSISLETTGITGISVSGSSVVGSAESTMTSDSASVKVNVLVDEKTYSKIISLGKTKQGTSGAYTLYQYALSTELTAPTDGWTDTMQSVTEEKPYLWIKVGKVSAGGSDSDAVWSDPSLVGTDIVSVASDVAGNKSLIEQMGNKIALKLVNGEVTTTDEKVIAGLSIGTDSAGEGYIQLNASKTIVEGSITATEINAGAITADKLDAGCLSGKTFKVQNDGAIQSADYEEGVKGFRLSADGDLDANSATLKDVTITDGTLKSNAIRTLNDEVTGSWCCAPAFPVEDGTSTTEVAVAGKSLVRSETCYFNGKEFAQWCLDNIPVNNTEFTKLDGTIEGRNVYAVRSDASQKVLLGKYAYVFDSSETKTYEFTFTNKYVKCPFQLEFYRKVMHSSWLDSSTATFKLYIDGTLKKTITLARDNYSDTWTTVTEQDIRLFLTDIYLTAGEHTIKLVTTYSDASPSNWSFSFYAYQMFDFEKYYSNIAGQIQLRLPPVGYDDFVYDPTQATSESMLVQIIYINGYRPVYYTLNIIHFRNTIDDYSTFPDISLSSCKAGSGITGWTLTRYSKFAGLYEVGKLNTETGLTEWVESPSLKANGVYRASSVTIGGTTYEKDFTINWNASQLSVYSDDGTVSRVYTVGNYYSAWDSIVYTETAEDAGVYVSNLYPKSSESVIGSETQPFKEAWINDIKGALTGNVTGNLTGDVTGNLTGNLTGNVNAIGTENKVYGCKYSGTETTYGDVLFDGKIETTKSYTISGNFSDYEWIELTWKLSGYFAPMWLHVSELTKYWKSTAVCFVRSNDFFGVKFPSDTQIQGAHSTAILNNFRIIGYK